LSQFCLDFVIALDGEEVETLSRILLMCAGSSFLPFASFGWNDRRAEATTKAKADSLRE
jgi:hypothetical protein